ncbi:MAG TPA: adenylate/guanylate cyclase domain-containing protein [Candidatus Acidoferrum sp.]|nr:adenylate/guanylate cyclase domain-containing protein [Candidatus Acidoferrum sp.]
MEHANQPFAVKPGRFGLLMSDLRGFTALTGQYPVDKLAPLLNLYFQRMTELIGRHGGVVDKFMGDSIFALFPVDTDHQAAVAMMSCAVDMQLCMDEVNRYAASLALPDIYMGIGLNLGAVVTCTLGSGIYREQTVLGDAVNLVARMAAFALRGQVLISPELLAAARDQLHIGASFQVMLKGKKHPVTVHELLGILHPIPKSIPVRENRKGPRVEVLLPISYHLIEDQRVRTNNVKADIIDLSYGGMRIVTPHSHQLLDEIKIIVPFGSGSGDVYAKVLSSANESDGGFCISTEFSYLDEFTRKSIRSLVDHLA